LKNKLSAYDKYLEIKSMSDLKGKIEVIPI
jgi:hypothetical protein